MTDPRPDATFPRLHIRPERGWLNDPNGVCRIDGTYHVFFQYNPDAPVHAAIHWGHASSTDLVSWRDEPVALHARPGALDRGGCWSGCVVDDGGTPTAVYTAIADTAGNARTLLATSDRTLRSWRQGDTAVMSAPDDPAVSEVRDPFVFTYAGHRYAVQGAGHRDGHGRLLLYGCDDLTAWTELGPLLTAEDPVAARYAPAQIWECPNLFELDGQWVLVVSLWRWVAGREVLADVSYLVGDLEQAGPGLRFTPRTGGAVDAGPSFYAPLCLPLPDRVLMWAWAAEQDRSAAEVAAAGWAGVLTFPRELYLDDGRLGARPAAELASLRRGPLPCRPGEPLTEPAFEVQATGPVRLGLAGAEPVVDLTGPVRILVDGSLVEVFAGPTPVTRRAYPGPDKPWLLTAEPASTAVWRLGLP